MADHNLAITVLIWFVAAKRQYFRAKTAVFLKLSVVNRE